MAISTQKLYFGGKHCILSAWLLVIIMDCKYFLCVHAFRVNISFHHSNRCLGIYNKVTLYIFFPSIQHFSIRPQYKPDCLFGSHAHGKPRPDSDVDIMVIVSDHAPNRYELSRRAYAALGDTDLPVELHFSRVTQFERFSTVVGSLQREVKQQGRILYAA